MRAALAVETRALEATPGRSRAAAIAQLAAAIRAVDPKDIAKHKDLGTQVRAANALLADAQEEERLERVRLDAVRAAREDAAATRLQTSARAKSARRAKHDRHGQGARLACGSLRIVH